MDSSIEGMARKGHVYANWARTEFCMPEYYFEPTSREELKKILDGARRKDKKVRVVGCGYSPSDLPCTDQYMVCLKAMNKVLEIDTTRHRVQVEAGALLKDLNEVLSQNGLALSGMGAFPDITIGGAVSTATHGSGLNCAVMSDYLIEIELMTADGEISLISRENDEDLFCAAAVSLGALGVIVSVTVQCEEAFNLHMVQEPVKFDEGLKTIEMDAKQHSYYSLIWYPHTGDALKIHLNKTEEVPMGSPSYFWDILVGYHLLQILYWIGSFLPWLVSLTNRAIFYLLCRTNREFIDRSDKLLNYRCAFRHVVMEYALPIERAAEALRELRTWIDKSGFAAHFPLEIRFARPDDLLLSPAYGRQTCYIQLLMFRPYNRHVEYEEYFNNFEPIALKLGGRPHWAKCHKASLEDMERLYPKWKKFADIRKKLDPQGRFLNDYLNKYFK